MGIKTFQILKYKTRKGETVELGHSRRRLCCRWKPAYSATMSRSNFILNGSIPNSFVGRAQVGGVQITKTMEVIPDKYVLDFKVVALGGDDERFTGLATALTEDVEPESKLSFLNPRRQKQEFFIDTAESKDRVVFGKDDVQKTWSKVAHGLGWLPIFHPSRG